MMRVYHSISAAMVKSLAFFQNRTGAGKKRSRVSARAGAGVARQVVRTLCLVLAVSLLVTSSPGAPQAIEGLARDLQTSAASWMRGNNMSAELYRTLARSYDRYENWATTFASGSLRSVGNILNRRRSVSNSAHTVTMPPAPVVLSAPSNLMANSTSSTVIQLSWTAPAGTVNHYLIERGQSTSGPFTTIGNSPSPSYNDNTVTNGTAYLYRVRAVDSLGAPSPPSTMALGTAITFADPQLFAGVSVIRAQHIYDLRQAVDAVRALAGLGAATWTDGTLTGGVRVQAIHVRQLRDRLGEALSALSVPVGSYDDPDLATGVNGTPIKKIHIEQLRLKAARGSSTSTGPVSTIEDSSKARLDPANRTGGGGEDPLSRNFNWSVPLVGLPGRSGLDLGLSLSYNSLVWTKRGPSIISFDDDRGFPSPGFRLGFPVIHPSYFNSEMGRNAFLLITPNGERVELRQVGASDLYEAGDSSHLLLDSDTMILRTTDGTQFSYAEIGSEYHCTQIKDRNGNFITINYTAFGRIDSVIDTLSRTIKFNYDGNNYLTSITQTWNGQTPPHTWASFVYSSPSLEIQTNFHSDGEDLTVIGPQNGSSIKVLTRVTLDDGSHFNFDYTSWGQVWKISSNAADGHVLNYRSYNLPGSPLSASSAQTDCPRFTERHDWAENWNRSGPAGQSLLPSGAEQEALTTYAIQENASWTLPDSTQQTGTRAQVTLPDNTSHKIYFVGTAENSGWQRGLVSLVETYDSTGAWQKKSVNTWTQDNIALSYPLNPRLLETNIYDPSGNRARTSATYQGVTLADGTSCNLPQDVYEYQANAITVLRRTHTDYNLATTYTSQRIIGLVSEKTLHEIDPDTQAETLMSKVGFQYDETGSIQGTDAPVQHDNTNYTASFVAGRANLSSVKRYDVTNTSQFVVSSMKYNTAGAPVSTTDPLNHQVTISYADSFSDGNNSRNTLAYPTTAIDADGFSSTSQYNYDFGAVTRKQTPQPNTTQNLPGPVQTFTYDSIGQIQKVTNLFNGAYTRYVYSNSQNRVDTFATIIDGASEQNGNEARSFKISDGHGRVIAAASSHPGSTGGFGGQLILYDAMGRAIKQSNPTETSASGTPSQWAAAGDDAPANGGLGWLYTQQTYDWKGRPLVTTNTDGTTKEASYGGCGCAGGEVVTLTDEGTIDGGVARRRQQKIYSDVLGRTVKTELLDWQGGSVYSATVNTYNARDQVMLVRQYQGAEGSEIYQDTAMTYDGHARLKTKHIPEQDENAVTTFNYNSDDTVSSVIDARGASKTFAYNDRDLLTGVTYTAPSGLTPTPGVSFAYDAAGNCISMTDGLGSASYAYDQLSRLTSETRAFDNVGSYTLSYGYNLGNQLTGITDPFAAQVGYTHDTAGRLNTVTGAGYGNVSTYASNLQYRAWGALKGLTYGNNFTLAMSYNNRLQATQFEVAGRPPQHGPSTVMKTQFDYQPDGSMKYAHDLIDDSFDRAFSYDHRLMLKEAYSGSEARDYINGTNSGTQTGPFRQSYQHDTFGNMTQRDNRFWSQTDTFTASYTNNRRQGFEYDADGNLIQDNDLTYDYDARGKNVSIFTASGNTSVVNHDGAGQVVKRTQSHPGFSATTYYVRSSVLDGKIITELNQSGQKQKGYVFAGGQLLAEQSGNAVIWRFENPLTGSRGGAGSIGFFFNDGEPDPMGVNVGLVDPFINCCIEPPPDQIMPFLLGGFGIPDGRCTLDGMAIDCAWAMQLMDSGAAAQCPNNDCGPRSVTVNIGYTSGRRESHSGLTNPFTAYADGRSGFMFGGMLLPDGFNVTFTGLAAQNAAAAFFSGLATGSFASATVQGLNAGTATQEMLDAMRNLALGELQDFLKKNPNCAEVLKGLSTKSLKDFSFVDVQQHPQLLGQTTRQLGGAGDTTLGVVIAQATAVTIYETNTVYLNSSYFVQGLAGRQVTLAHEVMAHGLLNLSHAAAADRLLGPANWTRPPMPPVNANVPPFTASSVRERLQRAAEQAAKRDYEGPVGPLDLAAGHSIDKWIANGCK